MAFRDCPDAGEGEGAQRKLEEVKHGLVDGGVRIERGGEVVRLGMKKHSH